MPYALNTTEYMPQGSEPTAFATAARKRIEDYVIESIEQLNGDRIVLITLSHGDTKSEMIIELFGRGNLILADSAMRITLAYMTHDFKDRSVRVGAPYKTPSGASLDLLDWGRIWPEIKNVRQSEERDAEVLSLMIRAVSIGKLYVEEALARAGIDSDTKIKDVSASGFDDIVQQVKSVMNECANAPSPTLYSKDNVLVDFSLCSITKYSGLPAQKAPSFQNLLDTFYNQQMPSEAKKSSAVTEFEKSLEKQRALIASLDAENAECMTSANLIMRNLHSINAIIDFLRQNKHATKEDVRAVAQGIKIFDVNLKDKTVRIEL